VVVAVGAFASGGLPRRLVLVAASSACLGVLHAVLASTHGAPLVGALALVTLSLAVGFAASALAALGRRSSCPAPAAGAVAAAILWTAAMGVWWVDGVAARVPPARRGALRQAVLRLDFVTAAAYGPAAFDRLRSPAVYEATTVGSLALRAPTVPDTSALWAGFAAAAGLASLAAGRRPTRRAA
jgi:hypothetical protein